MNPIDDITPLLDAELVPGFSAAPRPEGPVDLQLRRSTMRQLIGMLSKEIEPVDDVSVSDLLVPAGGAVPAVPVRVFTPKARKSDSVLLWLHGGGFCVGHHEDEGLIVIPWVRAAGCTVVSVGYRMAPEHPYPAAVDDSYAALQWLAARPSALGFAPGRIAVGGISAGACLAAATALKARDSGGPALCFQLLLVPCADNRSSTPSMQTVADTRSWNRVSNANAWQVYAGGDGEVPAYAAPARAADLSHLPPAYVEVAGVDPLRDEGIDYAARLMRAGVSTELHVFPGAFHASSYVLRDAAISRRARDEATATLQRVLG